MANYGLFMGYDRHIPDMFNDMGFPTNKRMTGKQYVSKHAPETTTVSVLSPPLLKAFAIYSGVKSDAEFSLAGTKKGDIYIAELKSVTRPDILKMAMYNVENGKLSAVCYNTGTGVKVELNIDSDIAAAGSDTIHTTDSTILHLCMFEQYLKCEEAEKAYCTMVTEAKKGDSAMDKGLFMTSAAVFCDNVYRRISHLPAEHADGINLQLNSWNLPYKMTLASAKDEQFAKKKMNSIKGSPDFAYFGAHESKGSVIIDDDEFNLKVNLTPEQKKCCRDIPEGHVATEMERKICEIIFRTRHDDKGRVANILLEGPPGTGKSQLAIAVSNRLGLPYYPFVCSDGTNEDSLLGCYYPVIDDEKNKAGSKNLVEFLNSLPTEVETLLKPEAAYEKLTGQVKPGVSPDEVNARIYSMISSFAGAGVRYEYRPSPIVEAFKNGGVVEIQEPSAIMSASVLSCLNDIMNSSDGVINTPIGPIKRHPDCYVIATTNPDSNGGYRKLNEAVRNRFQRTYNCPLPTEKEMQERVLAQGYIKSRSLIKSLVHAIIQIDSVIKEKGIQGTGGMRCLLEWTKDLAAGDGIIDSMMSCVIYNITTIQEEVEWLLEAVRNCTNIYKLAESEAA